MLHITVQYVQIMTHCGAKHFTNIREIIIIFLNT